MKMWSRRIVALIAVGIVIALLVFVLRPAPVRVAVAGVQRGRLQVTVDEEGHTRVRDRFVISAPIAGRVARLTLDAGDRVDQGTVVARMNPLPLDRRAHAEATARLAAAEAQQRAATLRSSRRARRSSRHNAPARGPVTLARRERSPPRSASRPSWPKRRGRRSSKPLPLRRGPRRLAWRRRGRR